MKVVDYIEYLKFTYSTEKNTQQFNYKNDKGLLNKLQKGMKDKEEGKECYVEEAFLEVGEILSKYSRD